MITKLDQLFVENLYGVILALSILAILVFMEEIWKLFRRLMKWAIAPPICKKCGGKIFRRPSWWKPEMSFDSFSLKGVEDWCRLPSPPMQECANCGELQ